MAEIDLKLIDNTWTLFIDRDGVINRRIPNDYVVVWEQFEFLDGVLDALAYFATRFNHIFIVTNQQGIGKGLMSEIELAILHHKMLTAIEEAGGRIDRIYYCPSMRTDNDPMRKPAPGMGLLARVDYPDVDFSKAIMAGDTRPDMEFGRNLNITTALIAENGTFEDVEEGFVDLRFQGLKEFAAELKKYASL
ncbi:MAG: HAD-IIIA family hydrolase [Bacteroidota bacterium]|nr:HAD-IIIA family hydrolase [Bacteroidota bacterium]